MTTIPNIVDRINLLEHAVISLWKSDDIYREFLNNPDLNENDRIYIGVGRSLCERYRHRYFHTLSALERKIRKPQPSPDWTAEYEAECAAYKESEPGWCA